MTRQAKISVTVALEVELADLLDEFKRRYDPPLTTTNALRTLIVLGSKRKRSVKAVRPLYGQGINLDDY